MKKYLASTMIMFSILFAAAGVLQAAEYRLRSLRNGETVSLDAAAKKLGENRLVLVGELHDRREHHLKQLAVILALREAGHKVAVGLEMFREDAQGDLDRWVSGEMEPGEFHKVYYNNWNFPWPLYSMIFEYARENTIPMAGLNVAREITRQVAYLGFDSLSEEQRGKLDDVACVVDEEYMAFIKKVHGDHSHGNLNFDRFCEAQLVWDTVMAVHALEYLKENPDTVMVLLTGNGHARKLGIPAQVKKRSDISMAVVLPETPDYITPETVTVDDADYLIFE